MRCLDVVVVLKELKSRREDHLGKMEDGTKHEEVRGENAGQEWK